MSVAAASALTVIAPHTAGLGGLGQAAGAPAANTQGAAAGGAAGGATGGAAANLGFVDYGAKVYGMGAKNQFALPPNPFIIQRAVAIANSLPNVLVVSKGVEVVFLRVMSPSCLSLYTLFCQYSMIFFSLALSIYLYIYLSI